MKRTVINLATEKSRGIDALKGAGVPAVFSDAVRIDLGKCALLFISGVIGIDEGGMLVGRTVKEQTRGYCKGSRPCSALVHRKPPIDRGRDAGVEGPVSMEPSLLPVNIQPDLFLPVGNRNIAFSRRNDDGLARRGRSKFF